jgi:hypothetical protein
LSSVKIESYGDLAAYLLRLNEELAQGGHAQIAKDVAWARMFATGSPSEFLHESKIVLNRVLKEYGDVITEAEKNDLRSAISVIDEAFRRVGGA